MSNVSPSDASSPTERQRCSATRKRDGQPCTAPAVREGLCAGHAGLGIAQDPKGNQQRSADAMRAKAAKRAMSFQDHLAAELEKEAATYVQTMRKAAQDGDWRALEAWTTRVLGKPVERVETTESGGDVRELSAEQRAALRRRLVAENPELLELDPARKQAG